MSPYYVKYHFLDWRAFNYKMISITMAAEEALRTCATTIRNSDSCWYSRGLIPKLALLRHSPLDNAVASTASETNHFHHINYHCTADDTLQLLAGRRLTKPGMSVCCNVTRNAHRPAVLWGRYRWICAKLTSIFLPSSPIKLRLRRVTETIAIVLTVNRKCCRV